MKSALALCSVALLAAAVALPASAQDVRSQGPLQAHGTFTHVTPATRENLPPSNVTIFNNFGTNPAEVWQANGFLILGPTSPTFGASQDVGGAFTTGAAAVHAKKVEVPVQYYNIGDGGTAGVAVAIFSDAAGLPGTALPGGSKPANAVMSFPLCCTAADAVTVSYNGAGAALAAATQYWVVVNADSPADTATEAVWSFTQTSNYSFTSSGVWQGPVGADQAPAAKVTGTNP